MERLGPLWLKDKCLLGIAVGPDEEGLIWEWGARRHPSESETNRPNEWWVATDEDKYIYNSSNKNVLDEESCLRDIKAWIENYHFECEMAASQNRVYRV